MVQPDELRLGPVQSERGKEIAHQETQDKVNAIIRRMDELTELIAEVRAEIPEQVVVDSETGEVDLSAYYTKEQVDALFDSLDIPEGVDLSDYYTKTQTNSLLGQKAAVDHVHGLNELSDVDTSTNPPADADSLVWDDASGLWVPAAVSGGGGGSSVSNEIYFTGILTDDVLVNPRPVADTVFPDLSLVIPGSAVERTFLVSGYVSSTTGASNNNVRSTLKLDGVAEFKGSDKGLGFSHTATDENGVKILRWVDVPIVVPGDGADHTITAEYNAVGTTNSITFLDRYLVAARML